MEKVIALVFLAVIAPAVYAQKTHTVGDGPGWNTGVNYDAWAKAQTFAVGDSLLFNYDPSHAVDEVREADYTSCSNGNAISSDSNSPTTITLTTAGTHYFICPRSNHCDQGMKLAVTVAAGGGGSSPSPPSGGAAPSPPSDEGTTPPATSTPSSPPPPQGNAATTLGGGMSLMAGLSLLLGAAMLV